MVCAEQFPGPRARRGGLLLRVMEASLFLFVALMMLHSGTNVLTFALGADLGDEAGSVVPRGEAFDSVVSRFEARSRDDGDQALGSITRAEVTGQSLGNSSERAPCGAPEPSREQREGVYRVMVWPHGAPCSRVLA